MLFDLLLVHAECESHEETLFVVHRDALLVVAGVGFGAWAEDPGGYWCRETRRNRTEIGELQSQSRSLGVVNEHEERLRRTVRASGHFDPLGKTVPFPG